MARQRRAARTGALALIGAAALVVCTVAQEAPAKKGQRLTDALAALQAEGLRIIFSTATVPPNLLVRDSPRAATPREQLDELLEPHGLGVREGPGRTLQVVRLTREREPPRRPAAGSLATEQDAAVSPRYTEYVLVPEPPMARTDRGVPSEMRLDRDQLARMHGSLAEDPLRAVQALPGVAAVDDFRSDFAVRGSPFRHVDLVIDGVSTSWLQHTAHVPGGASGSLPMLSAHVLDSATLRAGAYPRRHGDRLGAELELAIREGSRRGFGLQGGAGGRYAFLLGEGPLASGRGSWLIAVRQSYLEWPPERAAASRPPFGFSDGLSKLALDIGPSQKLTLTVLAGASVVDTDEEAGERSRSTGENRAGMGMVSWEAGLGRTSLRQQVSYVRRSFTSASSSMPDARRAINEAAAYRVDLRRAFGGVLFRGGGRVERQATAGALAPSWNRSIHGHALWAASHALTVSSGARMTWSSLVTDPMVSPWLLAEWAFRPAWNLTASAGASRQPPDPGLTAARSGAAALLPERARLFDVGLERRSTDGMRWRATLFRRDERDILRRSERYPGVVEHARDDPHDTWLSNALRGSSEGIELFVERRRMTGLSGWAAYSYGVTRFEDRERGETFRGDFDQRHTLHVSGAYGFAGGASAGAALRAAGNVPLASPFTTENGRAARDAVRSQPTLPTYLRMDVRAAHPFQVRRRRVTAFIEVLNLFDRANVTTVPGVVDPQTGGATVVVERLMPRSLSIGATFRF